MGMEIAIDDFGTGYSSLAYLTRLPVNVMKVDRTFISSMLDDDNAMMMVQTILSVAASLKLRTIAEGVESEEQADMLALLGCDEMQGYLISPPLPRGEITPLLKPST
jgi:EAL domain-containing protein (putative c-di-GMP-specific phosphodiesterase class I)